MYEYWRKGNILTFFAENGSGFFDSITSSFSTGLPMTRHVGLRWLIDD